MSTVDPQLFARIERWNYLLTAIIAAVGSLALHHYYSLGLTVGAVICSLNFSAIRRVVSRLTTAPPERRSAAAMLFAIKMGVLILAVFLAIRFLPMSPVTFAIGFSIFVVSIAIESVRFALGSTVTAS